MIWLLGFLTISIPLASWKFKGTLFTPWSLYSLSQFGGMMIALFNLLPAMTDPTLATWAMFWSSAAAFFLGCFLASGKVTPWQGDVGLRWLPALKPVFLILFILWLSSVADGYLRAGGWPSFQVHADLARELYSKRANIMWYTSQAGPVQALLGLAVAWTAPQTWLRRLGWFGFLFSLWVSFATGMRFGMVTLLIVFVILYDFKKKRVSPSMAAGMILLLGSTLSAMFILRQTHLQSFVDGLVIPWDQKIRLAVLPIYTYCANCFWNLDTGLARSIAGAHLQQGYGYWTFNGLLFFTHLHVGLNTAYGFANNYISLLKIANLNTATWQWYVYLDFGWAGVLIYGLLWGMLATWCTRLAGKSLLHAILSAYVLYYVAFSFFTLLTMIPEGMLSVCVLMFLIINGKPSAPKETTRTLVPTA